MYFSVLENFLSFFGFYACRICRWVTCTRQLGLIANALNRISNSVHGGSFHYGRSAAPRDGFLALYTSSH